ncbi:Enamine/imine deaminase [Planctomycetes bacterium Poly30]|uniref:Enamine/imine deaminase n=1 Tax=Saltatorellus ferox TaxID=2528018 RepID=A0A518EW38_9BACT|nr:Enamine/imine deaminase [Planctomycetes bacterium Poly30]
MTNERQAVSTLNAPSAIGPYHQAIIAGGMVHCSGQIALDPVSMEIVEGGVAEQTVQVMKNLEAVLEAAGSSLKRAVRCTIFLADMNDFGVVNEIYGRAFEGVEPPARATVEVSRLPKDVRVEIDCLALA